MFNRVLFSLAVLFVSGTCTAGEGASLLEGWPEFTSPSGVEPEMYRGCRFSEDWRLLPLNPVDGETVLHTASIGVLRDFEGRIVEAEGYWMGNDNNVVLVNDMAPLIHWCYWGNTEVISLHYADGTPFCEDGFYGMRVIRDPESGVTTMQYLDSDGAPVVLDGILTYSLAPDGDDWYLMSWLDPSGNEVTLSDYPPNRFRMDPEGFTTGTQCLDQRGNLLGLGHGAFTKEVVYDSNGNVQEILRYGIDGEMVSSPYRAGWKVYDVSDDGLTLSCVSLDPEGDPWSDYYGVHLIEYEYDRFGRRTAKRIYGPDGEPVTIEGVWESGTEYLDDGLIEHRITRDSDGNPVDFMGIAVRETVFGPEGTVLEKSFWNTSGEPVPDLEGVHLYRFTYDMYSNPLEVSNWDTEGNPVLSSWGYHIERYSYSENGEYLGSGYFGLEGNPVILD